VARVSHKKVETLLKKNSQKKIPNFFVPCSLPITQKEKKLKKKLRTAHFLLVVKKIDTIKFQTFFGPRPLWNRRKCLVFIHSL
jgi:hypothetical protein